MVSMLQNNFSHLPSSYSCHSCNSWTSSSFLELRKREHFSSRALAPDDLYVLGPVGSREAHAGSGPDLLGPVALELQIHSIRRKGERHLAAHLELRSPFPPKLLAQRKHAKGFRRGGKIHLEMERFWGLDLRDRRGRGGLRAQEAVQREGQRKHQQQGRQRPYER